MQLIVLRCTTSGNNDYLGQKKVTGIGIVPEDKWSYKIYSAVQNRLHQKVRVTFVCSLLQYQSIWNQLELPGEIPPVSTAALTVRRFLTFFFPSTVQA